VGVDLLIFPRHQQPALELWQGKDANVLPAQKALVHRAQCNRAARRGEYSAAMDSDTARDTASVKSN
jgi:fructose-bisphosphate aldolase class I